MYLLHVVITVCNFQILNTDYTRSESGKAKILLDDQIWSISIIFCGIRFLTPSTLERHSYYHILPLPFPCQHAGCDRLFPFSSDRDRHALVHRTSSDWVCMYPKCGKRFLAKGELTKHAKVHDGIQYECDVCTYTNPDIRNVKAHEWSHRMGTAGHRYFCDICGQGFTWYTSWQRHKFSKKKCVAPSNSPQY